MAYAPTLVANNVLNRAFAEKQAISPMKLQKILYFVGAEYQKQTHEPLFTEQFETWQYGPVLRSVYREFSSFSRANISRFAKDADSQSLMIDESADSILGRILDRIWAVTRDRSAVGLSRITHLPDSAWDRSFQQKKSILSEEDIEKDFTYYSSLGLVSA